MFLPSEDLFCVHMYYNIKYCIINLIQTQPWCAVGLSAFKLNYYTCYCYMLLKLMCLICFINCTVQ